MGEMEQATMDFIACSPWIRGAEYAPLRLGLINCARQLDKNYSSSMNGEYSRLYRQALKLKPVEVPVDPLEALLKR